MIGLVHDRPADPLTYIQSCMEKAKKLGGVDKVLWDSFLQLDLPDESKASGKIHYINMTEFN